ncbi:acyltransferase family protein [Massilia sp. TWR1-2-2]|uniref:acyltransferase family protein n=1 Tax=Massilia sp. TWR1-2-2 TaxID=2804584 RepID=UPI003CF9964D
MSYPDSEFARVQCPAPDRANQAEPHIVYRADIDGLRAVAVLLVMLFHAFPTVVQGGFIGVDIFFVISGYLISGIIYDKLDRGNFNFADFYARRICRIFPALLVVMAACLAFGWFAMLASEYKMLGRHLASGAGFIANLTLWQESGYFDSAADTKPLLHLWSLGIEEQFYVLWPLALWAAHRLKAPLLALCLVLAGASFALNVALVDGNPVAAFYSPGTRFWELLAGSVVAYGGTQSGRSAWGGRTPGRANNLMAVGGLILIAAAVALITPARALPGWWALLPVLGTCMLLAAGTGAWFNRTVLAAAPLVWVGLISYPLYLWHWPLLVFARLAEYNGAPPWPIRLAALALSVMLAWLTFSVVEKQLRFGRARNAKVAVLCLLMLGVGAAGYEAHLGDGLPSREANAKVALFADILSPPQTRMTNDSCQRLLARPPVPGAVCLAKSAQPRMLVMGDSHAMAFNSAALTGRSALDTVLLAGHGCLPFISYQNYGPQENRAAKKCYDLTAEALAMAATVPSIETVLLVSRGPLYFSGRGFGMEETDPRWSGWRIEPVRPGASMPSHQAFVAGYVEVAKQLLALGKKVVFVIDVPEFGINPEVCIANRPVAFRNQSLPSCVLSRVVVDARQRQYRELIGQIQAQVPGLLVYDTRAAFCSETSCASKDDRQVYFYDNNHVNLSGSAKLLDDLAAWLQRQ